MPIYQGKSISLSEYYSLYKPHVDTTLSSYIDSLTKQLNFAKLKIEKQAQENSDLNKIIENLKREIDDDLKERIKKDIGPLEERNHSQEQIIKSLKDTIKEFDKENTHLKDEIGRLNGIIKKDSTNSSKNPASDAMTVRKQIFNSRVKRGLIKGGQKGHKVRTPNLIETPDEIISHKQERCECGSLIDYNDQVVSTQTICFELVVKVVQDDYYKGVCPVCGKIHKNGALKHFKMNPTIFDDSIEAIVVYLSCFGMISLNRIVKTIYDFSNGSITISEAQILNIINKYGKATLKQREIANNALSISKTLNIDETQIKFQDYALWVTTVTNGSITVMFLSDEKGHKLSKELIHFLREFKGNLVHDHFKYYYTFTNCSHAECNAHAIRYLDFGHEIENNLYCKLLKEYLLSIHNQVLKKDMLDYEKIKLRYMEIINDCLNEYQKHPVKNKRYEPSYVKLMRRMKEFAEQHLAFVLDTNIPFTNNNAETTFRSLKTKQKVSGRFYSKESVESQTNIRAYILSNGDNWFNSLKELVYIA
jgi:transposase